MPESHAILALIGSNSVETCTRQNSSELSNNGNGSVGMNCKDPDAARARVECIQELTIAADGYVQVRSTRWICSYYCSRKPGTSMISKSQGETQVPEHLGISEALTG